MAEGSDFNIPGDPDYDRRQQEARESEQQDIANAADPNWVPTSFGGYGGQNNRALTAYYNRAFTSQETPTGPSRVRNWKDIVHDDPYSGYLDNILTRGLPRGGKGGPSPAWRQAADLIRQQAITGRTLQPKWAQAVDQFRAQVPLELVKKWSDAITKAHSQKRNMRIASTLISMATMGAGGLATSPLSAAAVGAAGGAAQGISRGAFTGDWDPKGIAIGTAAGAAGGAVGASGLNPAVAGAAGGGINSVARGLSTGKWDPLDIAWNVGSGAATGALSGKGGAGVPRWVTGSALPWATAGYNFARGRDVNPVATGAQSVQGGVTGAINSKKPNTPGWVDPSNAPYINNQGGS